MIPRDSETGCIDCASNNLLEMREWSSENLAWNTRPKFSDLHKLILFKPLLPNIATADFAFNNDFSLFNRLLYSYESILIAKSAF